MRVKRIDEDGKMYRCKATVMCVEEDGMIELLREKSFSNRGKTMTKKIEQRDVFFNAKEVEALQDFERKSEKVDDPFVLKEQGNILFKLRDFETAECYYMRATRADARPLEEDAIVYIQKGTNLIRCKVVSTEDRGSKINVRTCPIIQRREEEYVRVNSRNVVCVCSKSVRHRELRIALHKNIVRCCMHRKNFNAALWHSNIAYFLSLESPRNTKNIIKILCLRARVYLECTLPRHAKLDVARAAALFEDGEMWNDKPTSKLADLKLIASNCENKQIRVLAKVIVKNMRSRIKTKRVLAKEFSVWLKSVSDSSEDSSSNGIATS